VKFDLNDSDLLTIIFELQLHLVT